MANAKTKRILKRLAEIKDQAAGYALNPDQTDPAMATSLAEEAAGLGLELAELLDPKGK